jgi:hypothetical protein
MEYNLDFKLIPIDDLEIGKLYLIKHCNYKDKNYTFKRGNYTSKSFILKFVYFEINKKVELFDELSLFYEMIAKKHIIQEAMELRALKLILKNLIDPYI